jgi:hypothetical protein
MPMERLGRPIQDSRVDTSSSSTGDDVANPFNLKEDDLWWKFELCSGGGGIEGGGVGAGVGRCAWEAVYSADLPRSKPSSAASIL